MPRTYRRAIAVADHQATRTGSIKARLTTNRGRTDRRPAAGRKAIAGLARTITMGALVSVSALAANLKAAASAQAATTTTVDANYVLDQNAGLKNPGPGMYFAEPQKDPSQTVVAAWLWLDTVCGQDLTWHGYNQAGTRKLLNHYAKKLRTHRAHGLKVLFRPRYDKPGTNAPSDCTIKGKLVLRADSLDRQFNHIDAIAGMIGAHRDVVALIQAGYLGRWGEWNYEGYQPANAPFLADPARRKAVVDRMFSAHAAQQIGQDVEFRRPQFAREVIERRPSANVGLNNDCFMTTDSDLGIYYNFYPDPTVYDQSGVFSSSAIAKDRALLYAPDISFGGETCPITDDGTDPRYGIERWRSCANMVAANPALTSESQALHMNYLNGDWAPGAVTAWKTGECYRAIRSRLGCRFHVTRVAYAPTVTTVSADEFSVAIDDNNYGWSRLNNARTAKLILRAGTNTNTYNCLAARHGTGNPIHDPHLDNRAAAGRQLRRPTRQPQPMSQPMSPMRSNSPPSAAEPMFSTPPMGRTVAASRSKSAETRLIS